MLITFAIQCTIRRAITPLHLLPSSAFSSVGAGSSNLFSKIKMAYSTEERGSLYDLDYRMYLKGPRGIISPFHDVPLYANEEKTLLNMIVEVPRWSNAKMEISTKERMNPIKQDEKKGKPRYVNNCFPHHGYIWNYGALPQTWEYPDHIDENTKCKGDNDPLDVCEIGQRVHNRGSVVIVKPLGIMALIDEGETDWKLFVIDVNDPLSQKLDDVDDIAHNMPGFLEASREWFKIYKVPAGKPFNEFAFDGELKNKAFAFDIIRSTHTHWENLVGQLIDNKDLACENVSIPGSPYYIEHREADEVLETAPTIGCAKPIPDDVERWHFIGQS